MPNEEYESTMVPDMTDADGPDLDELTPMPGGLPPLPRGAAVKRLIEALQAHDHSEGAARAIARAITRPEEARRRLQNPDITRVKGGVLETISVQVWTAGITSFPGNNREAGQRIYPLSGAAPDGQYPSLGPVSAPPGVTGELVLDAESPAHVVSGFDRSSGLLAQQNDLAQTIGEHGILRDLMLTVVRIEHDDKTPPAWIVGTADGSSRATGAQRNLGLGAEQVIYQFPSDDRAYRGFIGDALNGAARPHDELTGKEIACFNSLVAPATLVLGFRPDDGSSVRFDHSIGFVVGLIHVEPPKPWGPASENDALGDAVIEEFLDSRRASLPRSKWYAATISPGEVDKYGLSPYPDTRVAEIAATFLPDSAQRAFRNGVLRITAKGRVTYDLKAKIVAEMALRPWRSAQPSPDPVTAVRSTLQRMLGWRVLRDNGWHQGTEDPDKLLDEALEELQARGSSGSAGIELALRGGYYLAIHRSLIRETSRSRDYRAPYMVLQRMTESEHGLRALHSAVVAGRSNQPPVKVDAQGAPERTASQRTVTADDDWLRSTFKAAGSEPDSPAPVITGKVETPESVFAAKRERVAQLADSLDSAVREAAAVQGRAALPLVRERGWPVQQANALADQLTNIASQLRLWAAIAELNEQAETHPDDDDTDGLGRIGDEAGAQ
ncbi:MAG TPA: hypothetical protein VN969_41435 [Streptosporangiaceae bacterium]|nr:hypothetical protein [Streptosporangiaceae bacterium]